MEKFDYEQVKIKMENLGGVFTDFMTKLEDIDKKLNDNINVGQYGAFEGVVATSLLNTWNGCSDVFVKFKQEFDTLLNSVMQVSNNNVSLEEEVMAMYGGDSSITSSPIADPVPVDLTGGTPSPTIVPTTPTVEIARPAGGTSGYASTLGGPTVNNRINQIR